MRFVTITVLDDALKAEMIRELLSREGIPAAVPGALHRSLLGPLGPFIRIPLQVPEDLADEARACLERLEGPGATWEVIEDGDRIPAARPIGAAPHIEDVPLEAHGWGTPRITVVLMLAAAAALAFQGAWGG